MSQTDPFEMAQTEIAQEVRKVIRELLLPHQTKKISKKLVEQIADECANRVSAATAEATRRASTRHAAQVTAIFAEILKNQQIPINPLLNEKLSAFAGRLSDEDVKKIQQDREVASRVVSRVYKSIFDFALERGIKALEDK